MAKKNAREEPPKPQVTENEQMSDIVFILDKMELILEAVSQIGICQRTERAQTCRTAAFALYQQRMDVSGRNQHFLCYLP